MIFCLIGVLSCSTEGDNSILKGIPADSDQPYTEILKADTIKLAPESSVIFYNIPEVNSRLFKKNRQFVFSNADLVVGEIDSLGRLVREITREGDGPGELVAAKSVKAWEDEDGDIYVLTNSNAFSLYAYDKDGNYKYVIRLFRHIEGYYHHKLASYFMSEKTEGKFKLILGISSTISSKYEPEYYDKTDVLAEFEIDDLSGKVLTAKTVLPFVDFDEIKNALNEKEFAWGSDHSIFTKVADKLYLTFPFSRQVYVFDDNYQLIEQVKLNALSQYEVGASIKMADVYYDLYERTFADFSAYLSNLTVRGIQLYENYLIVQYEVPLKESEYLKFFPTEKEAYETDNWGGFFQERDQFWLIHNLTDSSERFIRLPKGHHFGSFLNHNQLLVESRADSDESLLLKYTLSESIKDQY